MFFVGDTIDILSGIGRGDVARWSSPLLKVVLVTWGLSLTSGMEEVLGLVDPVGSIVVTLYMAVFHARRTPPPLGATVFSGLLFIHLGIGCVGLLSHKINFKIKKSKKKKTSKWLPTLIRQFRIAVSWSLTVLILWWWKSNIWWQKVLVKSSTACSLQFLSTVCVHALHIWEVRLVKHRAREWGSTLNTDFGVVLRYFMWLWWLFQLMTLFVSNFKLKILSS